MQRQRCGGHSVRAEKAIVIVWFGFCWELEIQFTQAYLFARVPELQSTWKIVGQFFMACSFLHQSSPLPTIQKGSSMDIENGVCKKEARIVQKLFFESVLPLHGAQENGLKT